MTRHVRRILRGLTVVSTFFLALLWPLAAWRLLLRSWDPVPLVFGWWAVAFLLFVVYNIGREFE